MASVREVSSAVAQIRKTISECLKRCRAYPSPSKERLVRIINAESAFNSLAAKFDAAVDAATTPSLSGSKEHEERIQNVRARMEECMRAVADVQSNRASNRASLEAELKAARENILSGSDENLINEPEMLLKIEQRASERDNQLIQRQSELNNQLDMLGRERQMLDAQAKELHVQADRERQMLWGRPAPSVDEIERELSEHLDRVGALEKDIEREAKIGEELRQVTKADFESKSKDFEAAETFHRSQARRLFWAILGVASVSIGVIYYLFILNQVPAASVPGEATIVAVERMVFFGVGRVALLFFFAWAIRYLADLHRSHSEQSVIYRDRKAALGVAQNILNASPRLVQKQELLRTLAVGYLDFEQNAFRAGRKTPGTGVGDEELKMIEGIVNAIRPLVDSLKDIAKK